VFEITEVGIDHDSIHNRCDQDPLFHASFGRDRSLMDESGDGRELNVHDRPRPHGSVCRSWFS
jgi:hypothetical protein